MVRNRCRSVVDATRLASFRLEDDIRLVTGVQRDHLAGKLLVYLPQEGWGKSRELTGPFGAVQPSQDSRQGVVPDPESRSRLM